MISINIYVSSLAVATELAQKLVAEKLALYWNVIENVALAEDPDVKSGKYILQVPTRSTLYNDIESFLDKHYPNHLFFMYAVPVVNTPDRIMRKLKDNTQTGLP